MECQALRSRNTDGTGAGVFGHNLPVMNPRLAVIDWAISGIIADFMIRWVAKDNEVVYAVFPSSSRSTYPEIIKNAVPDILRKIPPLHSIDSKTIKGKGD